MEKSEAQSGCLVSLGVFAAWMIAAFGTVAVALAIREAVLSILAWVRVIHAEAYRAAGGVGQDIVTNFGLDAIDYAVIFILAIAAVVISVWIEYYFRKGQQKGVLLQRIGIIAGAEIGIFLLAQIIRLGIASIL